MARTKSDPDAIDRAAQSGGFHLTAADEEFWRRTESYMPKTKQGVFIRLDSDVVAWLKAKGKGYQTRMNAMLRVLMESEQTKPAVTAVGGPSTVIEIGKSGSA